LLSAESEVTYLGYNLLLVLFDESRTSPLSKWYNLSNYAMLVRTNDWIDLTPSETRSIFGGLVCGAQASGNPIPVFFVSSAIDRISNAFEILGYEVFGHRVRQYESYLLDAGSRHEFYIDGIVKYFKHHLFHFNSIAEVSLSACETFTYLHSGSYLYQYWTNSLELEVFYRQLSDLTTTSMLVQFLRQHPKEMKDNREIDSSFLEQISAHLTYRDLNPDLVVDNDTYTTLIPSKQPPTAWSITATFRSDDKSMSIFSLGASACVRRILGLYVIGKVYPNGSRLSSVTHTDENVIGRSFAVSSLLSARSREALSILADQRECLQNNDVSGNFSRFLFDVRIPQALKRNDIPKEFDKVAKPPVGSWVSLFAILFGCGGNCGIEKLAQEWKSCLKLFRKGWEEGNCEAFLFLPTNCHGRESIVPQPLWSSLLWSDEILQWREHGRDVTTPSSTASLLTQKLQMLRFCTAAKNSNPLYLHSFELNGSTNKMFLARRLPTTNDFLAQIDYAAQSVLRTPDEGVQMCSEDCAQNSDPFLHIRLLAPALISDMRAFKAAYPDNDFLSFSEWYNLESMEGVGFEQLDYLFEKLDPCPAEKQKPLFNAEAEAEKVLAFLESITVVQFAAELLVASLSTVYAILREEASEWVNIEDPTSKSDLEVVDDFLDLQSKIELVVRKVREDVAQFGVSEANASISQDTLVDVDELCVRYDKVETWLMKAREIDQILTLPEEANASPRMAAAASLARRRLVVDLALRESSLALDVAEARRLFAVARLFSPGSDNIWQSSDGRELPASYSKTIEMSTKKGPRPECRLYATMEGEKYFRLSRFLTTT